MTFDALRGQPEKELQAKLNQLLVEETGHKVIRELIFTNYLYQ